MAGLLMSTPMKLQIANKLRFDTVDTVPDDLVKSTRELKESKEASAVLSGRVHYTVPQRFPQKEQCVKDNEPSSYHPW